MSDENTYDSYEALRENVNWLKAANTRQARIMFVLGIVILLLAAVAATGWWTRPTRQVVAVSPDLRVIPLTPLDQPVLTEDGVRDFAAKVTTQCLSLHFVSWKKQLIDCKPYFMPETFTNFESVLQSSGILPTIRNQRLDANVTLASSAVMVNHWTKDNVLYMEVQVPVEMSYEGTDGNHGQQTFTMDVIIRRVSEDLVPRGVLISGFVSTGQSAGS